MFFAQVPHTTISWTRRIIATTRLLISMINIVFLIFKCWRCFFGLFCTLGIPSYFTLLLGLSGTWIIYFSPIKVSKVFLKFLWIIGCLFGDSLVTIDTCTDISERLGFSFLISISLVFYTLLPVSDNLADEIYLYLFTDFIVSSVSVLWVDFDLSIIYLCLIYCLWIYIYLFFMLVVSLFCWLCQYFFSQ